jgi:hypothetical protein
VAYLKSVLTGIAAVVGLAVLWLIVVDIYIRIILKPAGRVGLYVIPVLRPLPFLIVLGTFLAGFSWELHRARSR